MNTRRYLTALRPGRERNSRPGIVSVLAAASLVVLFGFVAFGIDTGIIVLTQTNMQNAVDAASLAAAQEIASAVQLAGQQQGSANIDINSVAVANARQMAADVAAANGVYVDPQQDVTFGKRAYDPLTGKWPIQWEQTPYNVVKVTARREQEDLSAPDGRLKLAFGWAVGKPSVEMITSANAFVEARDLVLALDYSSSMSFDSQITAFPMLGQAAVEANLDAIWQTLVSSDPTWPGTATSKFPSTGFGGINSAAGIYIASDDDNTVFTLLGLGATDGSGNPLFPYPQSGKSGGVANAMPSAASSQALWLDYIWYVRTKSDVYQKTYGYRTLVDYMMTVKFRNSESEDLWRTPHYPFHAIKGGVSLLVQFLTELNFGDELGLVSYDSSARRETSLNEDGISVSISGNPITDNYQAIDTMQRYKQAAHYNSGTAIGYGIKEARRLLRDHARSGARRTILLMTDGQANAAPSGWSLPADWQWSELTDYDGDGQPDYTTSNANKQYAFWEAREAIRAGMTIHTMSVGADADRPLMEAIAKAGGGIWVDVPGGTTIAEMEGQLLAAFSKIAGNVPPPKLVYDEQ
jgi:Flp pilus assembly protein TadG